MKKIYIISLLALGMSSCKPNLSTTAPQKGNADFSIYLAVGNSLTAGYADGSLYYSGQMNSYPSMLATQFSLVGGGAFKQPLLPNTCEGGMPAPRKILGASTDCLGITSLSPVNFPNPDTIGAYSSVAASGPFNNVGVPGIRVADYLIPGYGALLYQLAGVPYAYRFYSSPTTETPLDEALKIKATFFTCWLGSNDVLLNATNGGVTTTPFNNVTPIATFTSNYDTIINALTANGAKGALMSIPDITSVPYFTTVPINGLTLRQGQADTLNALWGAQGVSTHFKAGAGNCFMVYDHNNHVKQASSNELLRLETPGDSIKCWGWGTSVPIPNIYALTTEEIDSIQSATIAFNSVIQAAATAHHLAYVDMYQYLKTVASGIMFNGVTFNTQFVSGGAFSLDGIHLTPKGYAIVANHILETINTYYGSTIPMIDVNSKSGIKFP